jgi:hypothetical protein
VTVETSGTAQVAGAVWQALGSVVLTMQGQPGAHGASP